MMPQPSKPSDAAQAQRRAASIAAGWTYFHSESLDLECAVKMTLYGPRMMTEDKVEYLPEELAILGRSGEEVPPIVHMVKKLFDGEVVDR